MAASPMIMGGLAERTLFLGPKIPNEIKVMAKHLLNFDKVTFRKLLQVVVLSMEGNLRETDSIQEALKDSVNEDVFAGLYILVKAALRLPATTLKQETFKDDLKELKIPPEYITDLSNIIYGPRRTNLETSFITHRLRLPHLISFRWRVDVGISTSVLNRVLEPCVLMQMILSDGKIHNFEVPISKFHQLRYNVAHMLKEMEDLEKRNILKIQD